MRLMTLVESISNFKSFICPNRQGVILTVKQSRYRIEINTKEEGEKLIKHIQDVLASMGQPFSYDAILSLPEGTQLNIGQCLHGKVYSDRLSYFRDGTGIKTRELRGIVEVGQSIFAKMDGGTYMIQFH